MCGTSASRRRCRSTARMRCTRSPDYSCAYVVLRTDSPAGLTGCGLTFTNGRGTEVVVAAVRALEHLVVGRTLEEITASMRGFWRSLDLRGPAALARAGEGRDPSRHGRGRQRRVGPLGQERGQAAVSGCSPTSSPSSSSRRSTFATSTTRCSETEALELLRGDARRDARRAWPRSIESGYPAYTTSAGLARLRRREDRQRSCARRSRRGSPT